MGKIFMGEAVESNAVKKVRKKGDVDIPPKPKFEFSKIMMIVTGSINISVIIFSMIMMWRTEDLSPLMYLIPSVSGECGVIVAFFLNKSKLENKIKLMRIYQIQPEREDFSDNGDSGNSYINGGMSI